MIADRFGSVRVLVGGLLLYGTGLYFMSATVSIAGFNISAGLLVGIALSATSFAVVYGAISRIVAPARRSWALGLAGAVGGLGQFLIVPGTQALLGVYGWTMALVILAVIAICLLPLAFGLRDPIDSVPDLAPAQSMSAAIGEAIRHRGFCC